MAKEAIQNFKLDEDVKQEFKKGCEENYTTPSHELRKFVHLKIKEFRHKKLNPELNETE